MTAASKFRSKDKVEKPKWEFEPRPFVSQTKVSFETPSTIVYDKKFDTAIRASHMDIHYKRVKSEKDTLDDKLTCALKNYPAKQASLDDCSSIYSKVMSHMYNLHATDALTMSDRTTPKKTQRMVKLAHTNIQIQSEYLQRFNTLTSRDESLKNLKVMLTKEVQGLSYINGLFDFANWWLGVINMSNNMYADYYKDKIPEDYILELSHENFLEYKPLDFSISWSHNYCVIKFDKQSMLLPKSYILLFHNKICDLISVLLYVKYAQYSTLEKTSLEITLDFVSILWELNIEYGQTFFTIAKCLEALATGETLLEVENWNNDDFMNMIVKDMRVETGFDYKTSSIRTILKRASAPFRNELSCLSKIAGHPFVDMEDGAVKLHKYTTEVYELDYNKINECICYAKQNYIRNHIVREGKWPPHQLTSSSAPMALLQASLRNYDPEGARISRKWGKIKISDYNYVDILPSLKFNHLENAVPHLKDKTISVLRSSVIAQYINNKEVKTSWADTRLLLYYLLNDTEVTDHAAFIKEYAASPEMTELLDYLVIRIVPKEKELKITFRGFGCTTYFNRMLFLAQEKNAMHYLDLYCDEQAMTINELDLIKRLYTFRCLKLAYPRHKVFYAMVDASKWNNHFRKETCDDVQAQVLDKIFGTSIFGKTQRKFENTLFYVPDSAGTYYWEGQSGGIEGLNQDTWVATYIPQIKTALSGMDIKYHILCKGDDLRLAILIPESDVRSINMKETGTSIMTKLSESAAGLGHDIKIYESYGSERYFNFSKAASVDKVELPQVYRKIQKCYGATNAFIPTIDEYIGSTFSNAHSACHVTTNVVPCYAVALIWSFYYLLSDIRPRHFKKKVMSIQSDTIEEQRLYYSDFTDDELTALMLCPNLVGGFPMIYLHNMMVRAESDLLPSFIDIFKFIQQSSRKTIANAIENFLYFDMSKKKSWTPVYSDPYCLPLNRPMSASRYLKDSLVPILKRLSKNDDVIELMDLIDNDEASRKCIASMDKSPICHAKVFSLLYSALPASILTEILNKFESSRSVMELLILKRGKKRANTILRNVVKKDGIVQAWRKNRLKGLHQSHYKSIRSYIEECPAKSAFNIRKLCWGKPIDGITMPPVAHLISFVTEYESMHDDHCRTSHFTYTIHQPDEFIGNPGNYHYGVGPYSPFLGKITSTGTDAPLLHMVEKDIILSKLKNIAELATWTDISQIDENGIVIQSNVRILIDKIIKLYTKESIETLAPFVGSQRGGTTAHHVRIRHFRESIMPNSLSNIYQMVQGETNSHKMFFGDSAHYWINFLHLYCYAVNILTFELNFSNSFTVPKTVWGVTTKCEFCMRVIDEPAVVIDEKYLQNVKFPQLNITKLNDSSKAILKESLGLVKGKVYNIRGHSRDVSSDFATLGLFHIMCNMTIVRQEKLADRYNQHPPTREGSAVMSVLVPQGISKSLTTADISHLDDDVLVDCLIMVIFQLMITRLELKSLGNLESSLLVLPSHVLPWFPAVRELHMAGKLSTIVRKLAELSETEPLYLAYTPEQVTPHLGILAIKALKSAYKDYPVVILSNYDDIDKVDIIKSHLFRLFWKKALEETVVPVEASSHTVDKRVAVLSCCLLLTSNVVSETSVYHDLEVTNEDRLLVSDIVDIEFDEIDQSLLLEDHELISSLEPYLGLLCNLYELDKGELIPYLRENINTIIGQANEWFQELEIVLVHTTLLACRMAIKANPSSLSPIINLPDAINPELLDEQNYFMPPENITERNIISIPSMSLDQETTTEPIGFMFERSVRRIVSNVYLHRPYGCSNDTLNRLNYIYSIFAKNNLKYIYNKSMHMMGDGIGNGTAFWAKLSKNSRIIFTTKPDRSFLNTYPTVAYEAIDKNNHILENTHIREGVYDLCSPEVLDHLYHRYNGHNIYFCDAEPQPGENIIYNLYLNVINYFLRSRYPESILIMQLSIEDADKLLKLLSLLSIYCTHVYIVLCPSVKCIFSHYIIVWGTKAICNHSYAFDDIPRFQAVYRVVCKILDAALYQYRKIALPTERVIFLKSKIQSFPLMWTRNPPLWVSYVSKTFNISVDAETLDNMKRAITSQDPIVDSLAKTFPRYMQHEIHLLKMLHGEASDNIIRNSPYDMNYHTHRIIVVNLYMMVAGWNFIHDLLKVKRSHCSDREARVNFNEHCNKLPTRDYDPSIRYIGVYDKSLMRHPNGMIMPYWDKYCYGAEMALSCISWYYAIYRSTHVRNAELRTGTEDIID